MQLVRHLADYVLVWAGGRGDDLDKSPHIARIGNSVRVPWQGGRLQGARCLLCRGRSVTICVWGGHQGAWASCLALGVL